MHSIGGEMVVSLVVLTILIVAVISLAARNWYEFGVPMVVLSLIYPWYMDKAISWWLISGSVAVAVTIIFTVRRRLASIVAGAWR